MIGFIFWFCLLFRWDVLHRVLLVVGWCRVLYSGHFLCVSSHYLILSRISSLVVWGLGVSAPTPKAQGLILSCRDSVHHSWPHRSWPSPLGWPPHAGPQGWDWRGCSHCFCAWSHWWYHLGASAGNIPAGWIPLSQFLSAEVHLGCCWTSGSFQRDTAAFVLLSSKKAQESSGVIFGEKNWLVFYIYFPFSYPLHSYGHVGDTVSDV